MALAIVFLSVSCGCLPFLGCWAKEVASNCLPKTVFWESCKFSNPGVSERRDRQFKSVIFYLVKLLAVF
eukprot:scaffold8270_cov47-Attheya_sp.AAC.1